MIEQQPTVNRKPLQHSQKAREKKVFLTKLWEMDVVTGKMLHTSTLISSPSRVDRSMSQDRGVWIKSQVLEQRSPIGHLCK